MIYTIIDHYDEHGNHVKENVVEIGTPTNLCKFVGVFMLEVAINDGKTYKKIDIDLHADDIESAFVEYVEKKNNINPRLTIEETEKYLRQ